MKRVLLGILLSTICVLSSGHVFAKAWNLPGIKIITRAEWGVNDSIRYSTQPAYKVKERLANKTQQELDELQQSDTDVYLDRKRTLYEQTMANDYLVNNYASEQTIDEVHYDYLGNYLKRPESIHLNKSKIIIHHTAGDYTPLLTGGVAAVKKYLLDIYKYHTITKGRGDIGYNFLIDPFGNIYEGRAGGEGVVGAQTAWNNTPSIGIALMGNFNIQQPTEAQLKSLINLSTALAKKYKIDPDGRAMYFQKSDQPPYVSESQNSTIIGHRDAGNTSCPGTNLYALLPTIRAQVKKGLKSVSLISAMTDFSGVAFTGINQAIASFQIPFTGKQISGVYYSSKTTDTFYLPISLTKVTSCKSADTSITVNSCRMESGKLKINITKKKLASGLTTISVKTSGKDKKISFLLLRQSDINTIVNTMKQNYIKYSLMISTDTTSIPKITHQITLDEAKQYMNGDIKVLLYELSTTYNRRDMLCDSGCIIRADDKIFTFTDPMGPIVESHNGLLYLTLGENITAPKKITISAIKSGGLVAFTNYNRASYAKVPRNTFRGSIIFQKDKIKNLNTSNYDTQFVVINDVNFSDYMKGIGETSETDNLQKIKLMSLLAKSYAIFYMNPLNKHPAIPDGAGYSAIDSPDMFQKYIGAGAEKTLKIYQSALKSAQNQILMYSGYVPILPYFSCSAGFTISAQEKRGWNDTPYLQARLDFASCPDFNGHGVGLSGKGAQYLAMQGRTGGQILNYYYPGVQLVAFSN